MTSVRALLVALLSVVLLPMTASSQNIPSGSYQNSCQNIDADWQRLSAVCRKRDGQWNYSTLEDYRRCRGDIANDNGRLVCRDGGGYNDDDGYHDDGGYNDDGYNDPDWTPRGSYQQSCRRIEADRNSLTAECRDRNGRWRYTELENYNRCRGDIANIDGMLRCERRDDDHSDSGDWPRGSWRNSCINPRIYGSMLYAECRNRFGRFMQTSIDYRRCNREIVNVDGRLVCGQSAGWPTWGMITLYKHTNYGGKSRSFDGDVPDLNRYAFGNQASSVVVQGGVWRVCDKPNYRGYCIEIDRTQSNLNRLGFNDRAESIRRIR